MEEDEMIHQLEHGMKFMKHDDVKEAIQKKILTCIINEFNYCNWIQSEIIDALTDDPGSFIQKHGARIRQLLNEDQKLDDILLFLFEVEYGKTNVSG